MVPLEHLTCGLAKATVGPNGEVFDWTRVTEGMFLVHSCKQHCRPVNATVAVKYHDYWFYIDDRDQESKATFLLMMELVHFSLGDVQYKGPMLTLPVGR